MFTGIIKDIGTIRHATKGTSSMRLSIAFHSQEFDDVQVDESICVNGVCLTVVSVSPADKTFEVDVISETLKKTTLSRFDIGTLVNLERALRVQDMLGGHWTLGHVDCVGKITDMTQTETSAEIWITYDAIYLPLLVPVGSITIDGISLTLAEIKNHAFKVAIIPYTLQHTTLGDRKVGDFVNIEFDILGKYVQNMIKPAK